MQASPVDSSDDQVDEFTAMRLQRGEPAICARLNKATIAHHIVGEDSGKAPPRAFLGHVPGSFVAQQIRVVLLRGVYRDQLPLRVNRVDPAMSVAWPLYPYLLSN
jgi:hypothetical protein